MSPNNGEATPAQVLSGCLSVIALLLIVPFLFFGFVKAVLVSKPFVEWLLNAMTDFWGL